jgi:hypothetical protein
MLFLAKTGAKSSALTPSMPKLPTKTLKEVRRKEEERRKCGEGCV